MGKRKLRVESCGTGGVDGSRDACYVTLYFNRQLTPLEVAGIIYTVKERLENGK